MKHIFYIFILLLGCTTEPQNIGGCTDPSACNFSSSANEDDGSCAVVDCNGVCGGSAYFDACGYCDDNTENDCQQDCNAILSEIAIDIEGFSCDDEKSQHYDCNDLEAILNIMLSNPQSLHQGMDKDSNQVITVFEYGFQSWTNGRLTSLDLDYDENIIVPRDCNFRLNVLPEEVGRLDALTSLTIKNNELTKLPKSIIQLTHLEELIIESNNITELPEDLGNLVKLKTFYAYRNQLTELPASITTIDSLEVLWLHHNNIQTLPENIGDLIMLEVLWLHHNMLTHIPESIGELENMRSLKLDYNQLGTLPSSICNLAAEASGVLEIDFSISNNLTCPEYPACVDLVIGYQDCDNCSSGYLIGDGSAGELGESSECLHIDDWNFLMEIINSNPVYSGLLPINIVHHSHWKPSNSFNRLIELRLEHDKLTSILPESIGNLDSLKILRLTNNEMTGSIPESIGDLSALEEIKINVNYFGCFQIDELTGECKEYCSEENECSSKLPESLTQLSRLEKFNVKDNYFTKLPDDLGNLTLLKEISVRNNLLEGELPFTFTQLPNLSWIDVANNKMSGTIPDDICNLTDLFKTFFTVNKFCPPYPACLTEEEIGFQNTSDCIE